MALSVYDGDSKMAGPGANMKQAWSLIRGAIAMGGSTPLVKYFGAVTERSAKGSRSQVTWHIEAGAEMK